MGALDEPELAYLQIIGIVLNVSVLVISMIYH